MRIFSRTNLACLVISACWSTVALAWDGSGHRMVTRVALRGLDESLPAWLRDEQTVFACADQSQQPDRWRGVRVAQLRHLNEPDHFIDVEDLQLVGLTLRTIPPLRHEYIKAVAVGRAKPGFAGQPIDPKKDPASTMEYPGVLPIATMETYGKVVGAFRMVRMLETIGDPARAPQVEAAKWNARVHIGQLSHYVGDAAQPLHTTRHHHGWIGDNPNGYTTDRGIHAYIDGGVLKLHNIQDSDIAPKCDFAMQLHQDDVWGDFLTHIERSFAHVEPLYQLKKSGELEQAKGKEFIIERLADGASMLSAMIEAAWLEAAPTPKDIEDLKKFEGENAPTNGAPAGGAGPGAIKPE